MAVSEKDIPEGYEISRIQLPDGRVKRFANPKGISKRKKFEYAKKLASQEARTDEVQAEEEASSMPRDMSVGEAVRLGLTEFAEPFIPDVFLYSRDERKAQMDAAISDATETDKQSRYEKRVSRKQRAIRRAAGVPDEAEHNTMTTIVSALSDPTAIVGPAKIKGVASILTSPVVNIATAIPSTAAGTVSAKAVYETDLPPLAKELLASAAGVGAGVATGSVLTAGTSTAAKALNKMNPSELLADTAVAAKLHDIKASEGSNLHTRVAKMKELQEMAPGVELPLASMTDNPIVESWVKATSASDPVFRSKFNKMMEQTQKKVDESYKAVVGDSSPVDIQSARRRIQESLDKQKADASKKLRSRMTRLDEIEGKLANRLMVEGDEVDIGNRMQQIADAKESAVRQEAGALYDKAISNAVRRGTEVPSEFVQQLHQQTRGIHFDDIFARQPSVATKAQKLLAPKKSEVQLVTETGAPLRGESDNFKPMPLKDLDSLKRATNHELRNTNQSDPRYNKLVRFKSLVEDTRTAMGEIDPEFVRQYAEADEFYYNELGLPLRAEGMQSISRSKFQATTAKQLLDPEKAASYLHFVGSEEGMPVIRHAIRLAANRAGVVDQAGQIDPTKLNKFVSSRERLIKLAGMEEEFSDVRNSLARIRESASRHEERYREASRELSDGFWRAVMDKELPSVMSDMVNSPSKRSRYLEQIDKLPSDERKMMRTALEQEFMRKAEESSDGLTEFLNKHKDTATAIYGKDHMRNIDKFFRLKDTLDNMERTISHATASSGSVDIFQQKFGVSAAEGSGLLRNQVLSAQRKAINAVASSITSKGKAKRDSKAGEILMNPEVLDQLTQPPKDFSYYTRSGIKGAKELGQHFLEVLSNFGVIAGYRGQEAAEEVTRQELLGQPGQ